MFAGAPSWISNDKFDIEANAEDPSKTTEGDLRQMLQALLAERFKLRFHYETQEISGYVLLITKNGQKLKEAAVPAERPARLSMSPVGLLGQNVPIAALASYLSIRLGVPIENQTGMSGLYDFTLTWRPDDEEILPPGVPRDVVTGSSGSSLFSALQEQLGLQLQSKKISVEVMVIDSAEKPTEN
jgi:uncharacterized protein (TIGR03435 family)